MPQVPFPVLSFLLCGCLRDFYAVVAWFVFWVVLALGIVQFVVLAMHGRVNDEVKKLSADLTQIFGSFWRSSLSYATKDRFPSVRTRMSTQGKN